MYTKKCIGLKNNNTLQYKEDRSTKMKLLIFWLVCNSRKLMCKFCLVLTLKTRHLIFDNYTNDHLKGVTVGEPASPHPPSSPHCRP